MEAQAQSQEAEPRFRLNFKEIADGSMRFDITVRGETKEELEQLLTAAWGIATAFREQNEKKVK